MILNNVQGCSLRSDSCYDKKRVGKFSKHMVTYTQKLSDSNKNLSWESKVARVMLHDLSVKIEIYADLCYHD